MDPETEIRMRCMDLAVKIVDSGHSSILDLFAVASDLAAFVMDGVVPNRQEAKDPGEIPF